MKSDKLIVRAAIHPGIGIARVGNSESEHFIGPEVPHSTPAPKGGYKDKAGALKRQAARFRIYGLNEDGKVITELTADNAEIKWTVHVANKKAAWYEFNVAMDIPEAVPVPLRNANFVGPARSQLIIDPGSRTISGRNQRGPRHRFDTGEFVGQTVYLGELRTDQSGRLLFLGGLGASRTPFPDNTVYTFDNNDGWTDDISDGPVSAEVKIGGRAIPVDPAWVVVAPPNYAPQVVSIQTMYEVMCDAYQGSWFKAPQTPSFTEHIYPILCQFTQAQWVNFGFYIQFGWDGHSDFHRANVFAKISGNGKEHAEARRQIFNLFRNPDFKRLDIDRWPQVYGDNMKTPGVDERQFMAVTQTQYEFLRRWSVGEFIADWDENAPPPPQRIEDVPLQKQPETLDKAALHFCAGGPFHPGCEITWIARNPNLYRAPFRIRARAANQPEADYGEVLTPEVANDETGPLFCSGPGDITRWMAVPWQTDAASCRAGYEPRYSPFLPTFWPARVPNHVLAEAEYEKVMNTALPTQVRVEAFNKRSSWPRWLKGEYNEQINQMITDFGKLGVVQQRKGPRDRAHFPAVIYVESEVGFENDVPHDQNTVIGPTQKVRRGGRTSSSDDT